jgi:hypothetical protein
MIQRGVPASISVLSASISSVGEWTKKSLSPQRMIVTRVEKGTLRKRGPKEG